MTKRFISVGFGSRALLRIDVAGLFVVQNRLQKFAKSLGVQNFSAKFFVLDHLLSHCFGATFLACVFLQCRARFGAPIMRGKKMPLWSSWSGPKIATLAFFGAFSLRCRAFWGRNCHSPRGFARWNSDISLHVTGFNLMTYQPPGNCRNKTFLAWGV